jgi:hypothetical protein
MVGAIERYDKLGFSPKRHSRIFFIKIDERNLKNL